MSESRTPTIVSRTRFDWEEDSAHENGNYYNTCMECETVFRAHKRRHQCKLCSDLDAARAEVERLRNALQAAREWIGDREYCEEWLTEDVFDSTQRFVLNGIDAALSAQERKP